MIIDQILVIVHYNKITIKFIESGFTPFISDMNVSNFIIILIANY